MIEEAYVTPTAVTETHIMAMRAHMKNRYLNGKPLMRSRMVLSDVTNASVLERMKFLYILGLL